MYTEKDEYSLAFKFTAKAKMLVGSLWVLWFYIRWRKCALFRGVLYRGI